MVHLRRSPTLFHTASTLSGSLRSPPSPRGEGIVLGTAALSQMAHLRRSSSLFFIPLDPYPARSARHLPHAGKALSVVILFFTYACIRSDNARKAALSYRRSLPPWGRLCRGYCFSTHACIRSDDMGIALLSQTAYLRRSFPLFFIPLVPYPPLRGTFPSRGRLYVGDSDALVYDALETIFSLSFIPLVPYPARFARHLPHAGKALCRGQRHSHKCRTCILRK